MIHVILFGISANNKNLSFELSLLLAPPQETKATGEASKLLGLRYF